MRGRCTTVLPVVVALSVGLVTTLDAQSAIVRAQNPQSGNFTREQRRQLELAERLARAAVKMSRTPKIVCGTTIIPADPKVDPKAIKPAPDSATYFRMRPVTPKICR
jgi:hypothetical protein